MMRQYQQGVVTLLITSILLSVALVVTLGSYKNLFYQIKRAQNEVKARQEHWLAEGGLECAFSTIKRDKDSSKLTLAVSQSYFHDDCTTPLGLEKITAELIGSGSYQINSITITRYSKHSKSVVFDSDSSKGAIQTEASLKIISEARVEIDPEKGDLPLNNGKFDCTAVRFKKSFHYERLQGSLYTTNSNDCQGKTNLSQSANIYPNPSDINNAISDPVDSFQSDYKYDPSIDSFYNYFSEKKTSESLNRIKSEYNVIVLTNPMDCSTKISQAFNSGNNKVWIEGHCIIYPGIVVQDSAGNITPRSLVVENGIFASAGSSVFDGGFYHLLDDLSIFDKNNHDNINDYLLLKEAWDLVPVTVIDDRSLIKENSVYIDRGSFFPKGGIYLDSPEGLATIKGSLNLDFISQYNPFSRPKNIKWKEGSWNAQ
ncbi:hypothetical protein OGN88_000464 [Vibrio cholerae]|nr:hypothetical protein [Vibrio cholerae]EKF9782895.1 hypothetical protein [Vibrio cholerae]EMB2711643.1 hypothetical protein [Vibrio cholerae]